MKFFIFRGEAFENHLPLLNNIHLDVILILCVYHVTFLNKVYQAKLSDIILVYRDKVLFPIQIHKQLLLSYYKDNFKKELLTYKDKVGLVTTLPKENGGNPNSTPIHSVLFPGKNNLISSIVSSPLIDNLKFGLKKKNLNNNNNVNDDFNADFSISPKPSLNNQFSLDFQSPTAFKKPNL